MNSNDVVTFLFTDIEGSTVLWEQHPEEMQRALERHDEILRSVIGKHEGSVFSTAGDAFAAAFDRAADAVAASLVLQDELKAESWPTPTPVRVRAGLHAGTASARGGDYFGPTLNRTARLMSVAHGGQTVCSRDVADRLEDALDVTLKNLGEHRLKDLLDPIEIFQLGTDSFPPLRSAGAAVAGLPEQKSPMVGRAAELERLTRAIDPGALVTVVGPGGIGKTRLAIHAAAEAADTAAGGAVLIDLSTAVDSASVWSATTQALDLATQGAADITERLVAALKARPRILVWDNCEQVLEPVAEIIQRILTDAPATSLVATSREPLDVEGETIVRVGPLAEEDAIALLLERAERGDVKVDVSGAHVGELIRALDGIPLAIELAATRLRSVPLEQMAAMASDLLAVLDRPVRGRPERQRTLRSAIDWSAALLPADTRRAFSHLGVVSGSFDVAAASAVCGVEMVQAVSEMAELADMSMVVLIGDGRYRLLEPLRLYAQELLEREPEVRTAAMERHADHFTAAAHSLAPRFTTADHTGATEAVAADLANYRAAMRRRFDHGLVAQAATLYADLGWYWYYSGAFVEGIEWATMCLEGLDDIPGLESTKARCRTALARLLFYRGEAALAHQESARALELARRAGVPSEVGDALIVATVASQGQGDAAAIDFAGEAIDIFRRSGSDWDLATACFYLGVAAIFLGRSELAPAPLTEAGELFAAIGDEWGLGGVNFYRGVLANAAGDRDEARRFVRTAVDQFRPSGDRWRLVMALGTLADLEEGEASDSARAEANELRAELGF